MNPAVDLGTLPANVFQTYRSRSRPPCSIRGAATLIDKAQLRITIDAPGALAAEDVTATSATADRSIPVRRERQR